LSAVIALSACAGMGVKIVSFSVPALGRVFDLVGVALPLRTRGILHPHIL